MLEATTPGFPSTIQQAGQVLERQALEVAAGATLYPVTGKETTVEALAAFMEERGFEHIAILDTKVHGIEDHTQASRQDYGYEVLLPDTGKRITVIDHHVSDPELNEGLSTGNLVDRYEAINGPFSKKTRIVITHKDCDSLISFLRASGHLPLDEHFSSAVLSADHTFEANLIGDVAQALEGDIIPGKTLDREELAFSIRNLGLFLQGKGLEPRAAALVGARLNLREWWRSRVNDFTSLPNGTAFIDIGKVESDPCPEFVTALIPEAKIILVFHEWKDGGNSVRTVVRTLRGKAGEGVFTLDEDALKMRAVIPGWGGRAGAGSDRRSSIPLPDTPAAIAKQLDAHLGALLLARSNAPFENESM